jgi:acetyl esterase
MAEVIDLSATRPGGSIPVRLYRPLRSSGAGLVFYHGGGLVTGGIEESDVECRRIAAESGRIVLSVGYRLAPEHRFPSAVADAAASFDWVAERCPQLGIDRTRLAVGGESAGGSLAAAVAQVARDAGRSPIDRQVFIYAGFDPAGRYPSMASVDPPPILAPADIDWCHRHYFGDPAEMADPRASPIRGNLRGLPPALIMVAEFDPLHDEGVAFADAMRSAGCEVELRRYPRQPHGFLMLGRLSSQAAHAFEDIGRFLRS